MQTPFSISKGNPIKLLIPKIGVSANIVTVGTTTSGNLDVPQNLVDVGWYKGGNRPGDFGNAVIDGHEVDELGFGAVFKKLHLLESGDEVIVLTDKNEKLIFNVLKKETYDYEDAPMKDIFGGSVSKNLNLITCAGDYIYKAKTKDKRLVIFTTEKVE
jgi:LPXTG-site transpeptidase (sortase) family protein